MSLLIICQPSYSTSSWYSQIMSGILSEKRSKRFSVIILDQIDDIRNFEVGDDDALIIISSSDTWLESIIDASESFFSNRIIVIGNFEPPVNGRNYSIVSSDIVSDTFNLLSYFHSYKKEKIALYGVNPSSASDTARKKSFLQFGGLDNDVYINHANLKNCFLNFYSSFNDYDAILCANDYCAISLMMHLKEHGLTPPFIASCGESHLAKAFTPTITNLKSNYTEFGRKAISLYKELRYDNSVSLIKISLVSEISIGETTNGLPFIPRTKRIIKNSTQNTDDLFYSDTEITEMLLVEKLLTECDETSLAILKYIICGLTYQEISERFYMSVNGIKYIAKKMFDLCGVTSKKEFLCLVLKYINNAIPEQRIAFGNSSAHCARLQPERN